MQPLRTVGGAILEQGDVHGAALPPSSTASLMSWGMIHRRDVSSNAGRGWGV